MRFVLENPSNHRYQYVTGTRGFVILIKPFRLVLKGLFDLLFDRRNFCVRSKYTEIEFPRQRGSDFFLFKMTCRVQRPRIGMHVFSKRYSKTSGSIVVCPLPPLVKLNISKLSKPRPLDVFVSPQRRRLQRALKAMHDDL